METTVRHQIISGLLVTDLNNHTEISLALEGTEVIMDFEDHQALVTGVLQDLAMEVIQDSVMEVHMVLVKEGRMVNTDTDQDMVIGMDQKTMEVAKKIQVITIPEVAKNLNQHAQQNQ